MKKALRTLIIILLTTLITSCNLSSRYEYIPPEPLEDGWTISTPHKEGFFQDELEQIISAIPSNNPKLDGIVIARNGRLVVDQYFNGYTSEKLHNIWSITKTVTGTLVGIASDQGRLSKYDSIYNYLGNYISDTSITTRSITIEHLITMTSGLEWTEMGERRSEGYWMPFTENWVEFVLSQPQEYWPGEVFNYSTGNSILLAPILKKATGKQAREYAIEYLFSPLGIKDFEWDRQSEFWSKTEGGELPGANHPSNLQYEPSFAELTNTGTGLHMRPRDLCKLGVLYLNKGTWNNDPVVSEKWIRESTQPHFGNESYGYHWRLMTFKEEPCYYASGFGMQRIFVFPNLHMVIVLMQQHYTSRRQGNRMTNQLLEFILRTINNQTSIASRE